MLLLTCLCSCTAYAAVFPDPEETSSGNRPEGSVAAVERIFGDGFEKAKEISIEERFAVMSAAGDYFTSLQPLPLAEKNSAMLSWLLEHPMIRDAGIETDGVWAYFDDGLPILFIDSRGLPGDPAPTAGAGTESTESPARVSGPARSSQSVGTAGVPGEFAAWFDADQPWSSHALFIDTFDFGWPSNEVTPHIQQRLLQSGYALGSVSTDSSPSMAAFKAQVQNLGLFYLTGHGTAGRFLDTFDDPPLQGSYYAIQSPVHVDEASFVALLNTDVITKRLVPAFLSVSLDESGNKGYGWRWAFTDRFISAYFSFSANSLSWIDACHSDDEGVRAALLGAGASFLIDWDERVLSSDAAKAEDHLIRRLMGSEQVAGWDSTPVRPFDIDSVWQEMGRHGMLQDGNGTNLTFLRSESTDFALLVPAIRSLVVFPLDGTLHLYGLFGADPGVDLEVVLDGELLTILSWDKWEIVAELPPTAHGEVYVSKNGVFSNTMVLSRYVGSGSATLISPTNGAFATALFALNFRGDFSPFRVKPDDEPVYWLSPEFQAYAEDPELPKFLTRYAEYALGGSNFAYLDGVSEINYSYGGPLDNSGCANTGSMSGGDTLPVALLNPSPAPPVPADGFFGTMLLNRLVGEGMETYSIDLTTQGSDGIYSNPGCNHDNEEINLLRIGLSRLDIDTVYAPNGDVTGGEFTAEDFSVSGYTFSTSLTLPTMPPTPAHDPATYPD